MHDETVHQLDPETLQLFAEKGTQDSRPLPQLGVANGVKVRRIMQLTRDLARSPFEELRILDMACGEGVYAIEAALRGANVLGVDARTERMGEGAKAASRLGLSNLRFEQLDIRKISRESHGSFDVVYFLGILYHLDAVDVPALLRNIYDLCDGFLIIDTHVALRANTEVTLDGETYAGQRRREHADDATDEARQANLLNSLDNTYSFWFTPDSLVKLLTKIGFTSVCVCQAPLEPGKPGNRMTLIAAKGSPVAVSSYPWINGKSEAEIADFLRPTDERQANNGKGRRGLKGRIGDVVNRALRPMGFELQPARKRN